VIVVDTSVWIAHFRDERSAAVQTLRADVDPNDIIVGDLILLECLQGARDDAHAARLEAGLRAFQIEQFLDVESAVENAGLYRALRAIGVTPRKTIDVIIAGYCLKHGHHLLHQDRDYDAFAQHMGLQVV
jgi:predicted nucleic acid-binding protein